MKSKRTKILAMTLLGIILISSISMVSALTSKSIKDDKNNINEFIDPLAVLHTLNYYKVTTFGDVDNAIAQKVQEIGKKMGYHSVISAWPSVSLLYSGLDSDEISVIHGHSGPGFVRLDQYSDTYHYLYAYPISSSGSEILPTQKSLASYSANQLSQNKLVIFNSCESAAIKNGVSLVSQSHNKGAKCVIGYNRVVGGSGQWSEFLFGYLHNRVTIAQAISSANLSYTQAYGSSGSSPTSSGNLKVVGDTSQKVRLN